MTYKTPFIILSIVAICSLVLLRSEMHQLEMAHTNFIDMCATESGKCGAHIGNMCKATRQQREEVCELEWPYFINHKTHIGYPSK